MPIKLDLPLHPVSQSEFGNVAYEVVGHAFTVHKQLGRIFDESVYRSTLRHIIASRAKEEVRITLDHSGFEKDYFIDLVVDLSCPFELKVATQFHDRHRRQLIQYLMLTGLQHGKLINFGGEKLEHEFVNCHETNEHRRSFHVNVERWQSDTACAQEFHDIVIGLLRDWGTGLDIGLYREAITFFLGGPQRVRQHIETVWLDDVVGRQKVSLVSPGIAFEVTSLRKETETYEKHLQRFLVNTNLDRIFWGNVVSGEVTFTLLCK